jgi:hypothetical protein
MRGLGKIGYQFGSVIAWAEGLGGLNGTISSIRSPQLGGSQDSLESDVESRFPPEITAFFAG